MCDVPCIAVFKNFILLSAASPSHFRGNSPENENPNEEKRSDKDDEVFLNYAV